MRWDFTWSGAVEIKRALEPEEKAAAKERIREAGRLGGKGSGKLPEASKGQTRDKVAKATGVHRGDRDRTAASARAGGQRNAPVRRA
jgi:general stress protein YciG